MKNWTLLKKRKIIDLFIGDNSVQNYMFEEQKMPYMSGIQICEFSEKLSRWQYMDKFFHNFLFDMITYFQNLLFLNLLLNHGNL